ncbi:hypothetical protein Taro_044301, partial [Colocasia esculenta]|nr:hypothetical protein [Colocasia esculenta]
LVEYPRFFVSQARVFVVLGVCPDTVWYRRGARGKAVMRAAVADQAGNDKLEGGVRGKLLGFRRDLRCGVGWSPQLFDFFLVERQLDLSSVTARLRATVSITVELFGVDIININRNILVSNILLVRSLLNGLLTTQLYDASTHGEGNQIGKRLLPRPAVFVEEEEPTSRAISLRSK